MNLRIIKSDPPQTPFAPYWDFPVATVLCKDIDTQALAKTLLEREEEIKRLPVSLNGLGEPTDGFTGLGFDNTTSRFSSYNLFTWNDPQIEALKENILCALAQLEEVYKFKINSPLYAQCWYNVLRKKQKIKPHFHASDPLAFLSGHFNVSVPGNTSTVYLSPINQLNDPFKLPIQNVEGEMTLFPSYIFHYTTVHKSDSPRITIAFDLRVNPINENWCKITD
jgi:hypothetical protein